MINKYNLLLRLEEHIKNTPNKVIFRYIENDEDNPKTVTFQELDDEIKKVASLLQENHQKGDRVLLLYTSGLDFIYAFFGCLYTGMIAVPAYPPRKNQKIDRLKVIIEDCDAKVVLTTNKIYTITSDIFKNDAILSTIPLIKTEEITTTQVEPTREVIIEAEDLAFLQYTSGSTGNPKGVMVSHSNIMSNMNIIYQSFGHSRDSIIASWLPHFHDMGLIGGVLQPIFAGCQGILISPTYFIQKPIIWLKTISQYKVTSTGSPNFGYELCINNIKDTQLDGLELSSWEAAQNGAEPILNDTLTKFTKKFSKYGFISASHQPCYGMAETTLLISNTQNTQQVNILSLNKEKFNQNCIELTDEDDALKLISCGHTWGKDKVIIVNNKTSEELEENLIGEIWVKGSSVTRGYWNNEEKTEETFHAYTSNGNDGPYLRTGDLGFIYDQELYVCGRVKDLIIIRGRNFYPQDLELSAYTAHEALVSMGTAAFSIEEYGLEKLIIVQEIKRTYLRKYNAEEIFKAIRESIALDHELQVHDIVLLKPGQLLKTSSGKIQRYKNKTTYLENQFSTLSAYCDTKSSQEEIICSESIDINLIKNSVKKERDNYIAHWLQTKISSLVQVDKKQISLDQPMISFGIDSLMLLKLQSEVMEALNITIPLEYFYDYPSIFELSKKLSEILSKDENNYQKNTLLSPIKKDVLTSNDAFNLNHIQQAYLLGRDSTITLGNTACFAYGEFETETLHISLLEKSWNKLIERHDMLRCVFDAEKMTQKIEEKIAYQKLNIIDISDKSHEVAELFIVEDREEKLATVLDASQLPLATITIYLLSNSIRVCIYIDMLICDANSIAILLNDLKQLYENPNSALAPIDIGFKEYLTHKDEYKHSDSYQKSYDYWMARLETLASGPKLPLIRKEEEITKPKFFRRTHRLDTKSWLTFKEKIAEVNVTPTAMLLAIYAKVLSLWSHESHFCINLTLFDRQEVHPDINNVLGDFTSLSPLEVNSSTDKTLDILVHEIQKQLFSDLDHKGVDGIKISRQLRSQGRESHMPVVFTSVLGLDAFDSSWLGDTVYSISQTPQVWIDNQVSESNGVLVINWDCLDDLFAEGMLDEMFDLYITLIEAIVHDVKVLNDNKAINENRFASVYTKYNKTTITLNTKPLPQQCMDMALSQGKKEAVICGDERLSYQQIHNTSAQLAKKIEALGIKPNEHVAILLPKGWEQVVSILACGYAGVSYLPLSIAYPQKRIAYLLEEACIEVLLGSQDTFTLFNKDIHTIDVKAFVDIDKDMGQYDIKTKAEHLAYTIFTSGSTGQPKGVMTSHKSVCNTIMDINQKFNVTHKDVIFNISELNFDLSIYDIYGGLSVGATIVIPEEEHKLAPDHWLALLDKEKVSLWNSVPTFMQLLCTEAEKQETRLTDSLRLVLMSGDFIPIALTKQIEQYSNRYEIISLGGATEASIWSIYYPISTLDDDAKKIPYGYPLANQKVTILDENLQSKPALVHGEICIQGIGIAEGYYKDKEKTEAQFVKDPQTGAMIYRTGDIGYFNPKGYIEIVGRMDDQVKIRGFRIELGEIEQQLLQIEEIKDAVVLAKEDSDGNKALVGFITEEKSENTEEFEIEGIISDPIERIEFKMEGHGTRKIEENETLVNLPSSKNVLSLHKTKMTKESLHISKKEITLSQLSNVFSCFKQVPIEGHVLAKYYYPSAGSLYPIQVYMYIPKNLIQDEEIEAGYYCYHRDTHQLGLIHAKEIKDINQIECYFIGNLDAISPIYGPATKGFCFIESGHMHRILEQNTIEHNIYIEETQKNEDYKNIMHSLGLEDTSYMVCQTFKMYAIENKDILVDKHQRVELDIFKQQNYYQFNGDILEKEKFDSFLLDTYKNIENNTDIRMYVYIKEDAIVGYPQGFYNYDNEVNKLIYVSSIKYDEVLFADTYRDIYIESGFVINFIDQQTEEVKTFTDMTIYHFSKNNLSYVGSLGQEMKTNAIKYNIGLSTMWSFDINPIRELLGLSVKENIIYSLMGGSITRVQSQIWDEKALVSTNIRDRIKRKLEESLPNYMIPVSFKILETMPLTPNGKVDKKALSKLEIESSQKYVAPRNGTEVKLAQIFEKILNIERVGIHDNFFELGGNSLLAVQLISNIQNELKLVLPLKELFSKSTLYQLSIYIQTKGKRNTLSKINRLKNRKNFPLSYAQEQLWFLDKKSDNAYHTSIVLKIDGDLSKISLKETLKHIVARHEALRTNFIEKNGIVLQKIRDKNQFEVEEITCTEIDVKKQIKERLSKAFNLEKDILFKTVLYKIKEDKYYLFIDMHHIVFDGWSKDIFIKEFITLYKAHNNNQTNPPLPKLEIQYGDYATWQRKYLNEKTLKEKLEYWKKILEGIKPLELPTSYPKIEMQRNMGRSMEFSISKSLSTRINDLSKKYDATLFMTLLSSFGLLMYKYSGQEDMIISSPIANRIHSETEPLIGFFINTLPLKQSLKNNMTFTSILKQTRKHILNAYEYQDVPFEKIIDTLGIHRDIFHSPLLPVMFILNNENHELKLDKIMIERIKINHNFTIKFDLKMSISEKKEGLYGTLKYDGNLFSYKYIKSIVQNFKVLLEEIVINENKTISEYKINYEKNK